MPNYRRLHRLVLVMLATVLVGCGTSKSRLATEQLLMSDAVDRTIAKISFHSLQGKTVYFDSQYIRNIKGLGFVNAEYVISSLRQHMVGAGCLLQEDADDAEYIIEARVGALGTDGHEITYGLPASTALADAASLIPTAPSIPMVPEIAIAKKQDLRGAAKIGVFAYHRVTREPVWQSGISVSTSDAKDAWILGAGPFQFGTIYDGAQFAGSRINIPMVDGEEQPYRGRLASYFEEFDFEKVAKEEQAARVAAEQQRSIMRDSFDLGSDVIPKQIEASQASAARPINASVSDEERPATVQPTMVKPSDDKTKSGKPKPRKAGTEPDGPRQQ